MYTIINTKVGESKGHLRIWLEGETLASVFKYGDKLSIDKDVKNNNLIFYPSQSPNTKLSVSQRKNAKTKKFKTLIELKDDLINEVFKLGNKLRIVLTDGKAVISLHGNEKQEQERLNRAITKINNGGALIGGNLCAGAGILDIALKDGFKKSNIALETSLVIEENTAYLGKYLDNHKNSMSKNSCILSSKIENVEIKKGIKLDCITIGMPCTAASPAGYSKNKLKEKGGVEAHEKAGDIYFYFLQLVKLCQPIFIFFECVPNYIKTAGYIVIKSVLNTFGYDLQDRILNGNEFGDLENRDRLCMVATTKGLNDLIDFDINNIEITNIKAPSIKPYIIDIDPESKEWKKYDYLVAKEITDKAKGSNFKRDIYSGNETSVSTIRRLYSKAGSCDQFLSHPFKPNLWRKFRAAEHGAFKGVPPNLYSGLSEKIAHECLGQSITFKAFVDVGNSFSKCLNRLKACNKIA